MPLRRLVKPWLNQGRTIRTYVRIYGGIPAIILSPFALISVVFAASVHYFTTTRFGEIGLSVLPNLLGFTIGAMAILLAIAGSAAFRTLAEKGEPNSYFMKFVANLLHYIVMQSLTIFVCLIDKSFETRNYFNIVTGYFFTFSVLSPVAMGIQLFQMAQIYNSMASLPAADAKDRPPT